MRTVSKLALAAVVALAGCGRQDPPPAAAAPPPLPTGLAYACQGGGELRVVYAGTSAVVSFGPEAWNMVRTADPGRFTAQGRQWQVRAFPDHEEGVLTALGAKPAAIARCTRQGRLSTAAAALPVTGGSTTCAAGDLSLKLLGEDAGAGQRHDVFAVKNRGLAACAIQGFATVGLLDDSGQPLKLKAVQSLTTGPNAGPAAKLQLAPGQRAVFYMHYTVMPVGDQTSCPKVSRLNVVLPGGRSGLVPLKAEPCGGQVEISPLRQDPGSKDGM